MPRLHLVPDRDNRYVPGDVIFGLNNLLRGFEKHW